MKNRQSKRRLVSLCLVVGLLAALVVVVGQMPQSQIEFWFGSTVDHCPDMEMSCPSTQPGVGTFLMLLVFPLLIWEDSRDE